MNIQNKDFIFTLFGVSGREDKVKEEIKRFVEPLVDEVLHDTTGSLICIKKGKGKSPKRVMVSAHMDTIGFIVTYIDKRGFLRFSDVGNQIVPYMLGRRVIFESGVIGVIGIEKLEEGKLPSKEHMFIDIGENSSVHAEKKVKIGDMCAIYAPYSVTHRVITGGWMDDRIGCFILLEALENLKRNPNDIYFVFSSQEEVGLRGATTSAYRIKPDVGVAVDVTHSSDLPEGELIGSSIMGKGAGIKVMDQSVIVPKKLVDHFVGLARKNSVPYQLDVIKKGGTDAHAIQLTGEGTFSGGISIPTRYIHSSGEMCALEDVQACIDLLLRVCEDRLQL